MINYESEVAVKCGINAAVIADYLWNLKENHRFCKGKSAYRYGKVYITDIGRSLLVMRRHE